MKGTWKAMRWKAAEVIFSIGKGLSIALLKLTASQVSVLLVLCCHTCIYNVQFPSNSFQFLWGFLLLLLITLTMENHLTYTSIVTTNYPDQFEHILNKGHYLIDLTIVLPPPAVSFHENKQQSGGWTVGQEHTDSIIFSQAFKNNNSNNNNAVGWTRYCISLPRTNLSNLFQIWNKNTLKSMTQNNPFTHISLGISLKQFNS